MVSCGWERLRVLSSSPPLSARVSYLDWMEGFGSTPRGSSLVWEVFQEHWVPVAISHLLLTPDGTLRSAKREAQWLSAGGGSSEPVLGFIPAACCAHVAEEKMRPSDSQCESA